MEILLVNKSSELLYTFPFNEHGYWEIILNLYGSGIATINGLDYPFEEGTIFCIPPYTLHRKMAPNGFTDGCMFIKDFTPINSREVAVFEDDTNHTFYNLFMLAFNTQLKNEPNSKAIINSLGDVMYQILISWSYDRRKRHAPAESFQKVLLDNLSNGSFNIADEIKKTGYCSSYFRKNFKSFTGFSPVNYLNHLRIEYAKKQLQQYHDHRSIKEIAISSGFTDPYYFSRVFKQHEGVSPQHYIKGLGTYSRELIAGINRRDTSSAG